MVLLLLCSIPFCRSIGKVLTLSFPFGARLVPLLFSVMEPWCLNPGLPTFDAPLDFVIVQITGNMSSNGVLPAWSTFFPHATVSHQN